MYELLVTLKPFFLVGIGAITGSWMRLHLTNYFGSIFTAKCWGTCVVNIAATFLLGFVGAIHNHSFESVEHINNNSPLILLLSVGFLGSLSTFSTFTSDLRNTLLDKNYKLFFSLTFLSIFGGLSAAFLGLIFGNV